MQELAQNKELSRALILKKYAEVVIKYENRDEFTNKKIIEAQNILDQLEITFPELFI